ncbi:MAG: Ppx/GppA phosphatase family protein [Sulfurimonas sp.]|nr:Ppx/GppA phosphatase family protein [Sulfurimonas sp.]MDD5203002.1 Ppx/GppA phosphatase family protein [Sulfurimonas sp.]
MAKRVAVIDIGSNSVRMVVYERTSRFAFHLLHEAKSKVRISENAYEHGGYLQEVPMQRTFDALADFLTICASFSARKVFCVATSALRDAPNKKDFLQKVKEELKLGIKIIDGEKEAYYGAIACANLLPEQTNAISIDIGGGSTEFSIINRKNVSHTLSLELGTVRLKELFFDKGAIDQAIIYIDKKLELLNGLDASTLIGIGGTFRAISSAIMNQESYPLQKLHAYEYSVKKLQKFISNILEADESELKKLGIQSNRFDVIKPGALILERVLHKIAPKTALTSGVGVREGVYLADLLRGAKDKLPVNYNTSVRYILDSHLLDTNFSNQLNALSKKLFDITSEYFTVDGSYRYELGVAAKLYPAGGNVHFYSKNKHSYYLIQTALEYGFTHKQIVLISTLAKYAKKKLPDESHSKKYASLLPDTHTLNFLSYLLSLSIALLSHRPRNIDFDLRFEEGVLFVNSEKRLYLSKEAVNKLDSVEGFSVTII